MDEKKLEELYKNEIDSSAPDMDALWDRIEEKLPEKPAHKKTPVITLRRAVSVLAAAAAVIFIIPTALRLTMDKSYSDIPANKSDSFSPAYEAETTAHSEETTAALAAETTTTLAQVTAPLSYDDLSLAPSCDSDVYFSGESYGDTYFVEDSVLTETEIFVDAVIDRVYSDGNGNCVYYELSAKKSYPEDAEISDKLTISSRSPYEMKISREYFIPLKNVNGEYRTVFDNAPQIEFTLDGGVVYHTGWKSLDGDNSESIIYPADSVDDYFYDRMKFCYPADIESLIEKWKTLNNPI